MSKEFLGEFEEIILTMVAALREEAYGAMIADEIEKRLNRSVKLSAVHVTLYRLQDKGLIDSHFGGGTAQRGGRKKRLYTVTDAGMAILLDLQEKRLLLWNMVPQLKLT